MPSVLPPPKTGRWIERWSVESDDMDREYVVSRDAQGEFGCSCPQWKFGKAPKVNCKHIELLLVWLRHPTPATSPARGTRPPTGETPVDPKRSRLTRKRDKSGS